VSNRPNPAFRNLAIALATVGLAVAPCPAQSNQAKPPPRVAEPPIDDTGLTFSISAGYQHTFNTSLHNGGDYEVNRVGLELKIKTKVADDWRLEGNLRYMFDNYKFSGATNLGGNPWSDINTLQLDVRAQWWMNNDMALIFGPFLMWSRESGASWSDSLTGGAFAGVMFVSSAKFAWGGGIGLSSQLEDSLLVYPILFLDWKFTDSMKLSSVAGPVGLAFTGVEWVWEFVEHFELGVGARYEFRRFRLDESGVAPNGVGEDTEIPFWGRLSYRFNEHVAIDGYAGFIVGTEFILDDSGGNRLGSDKSDAAPTIALAVRIDF